MNEDILSFLQNNNVCVLAVEMPDGSPHAATVHFANTADAGVFFFETDRKYRKSEALFGRSLSRASLVVGSTESEMKTLQMDGSVRLITEQELGLFNEVYLGKFPKKAEKLEDPDMVRFAFTPSWWRYTDWTKPSGKTILSSDDSLKI